MISPKTIPRNETSRPINSRERPLTRINETCERSGRMRLASPPLLCPTPSPCGCAANADVALTTTRAKPAAIAGTTRRNRVIEEKMCFFRQSIMVRLMPRIDSNISWRFLIQFGFLSLQQVADYRQSELSCKVVKSRIYRLFAHQAIRLSGQTNIIAAMNDGAVKLNIRFGIASRIPNKLK